MNANEYFAGLFKDDFDRSSIRPHVKMWVLYVNDKLIMQFLELIYRVSRKYFLRELELFENGAL